MEKLGYLEQLSTLLEVDIAMLTDDFLLQNNQLWDSLSIISTMAAIDSFYHVSVKAEEIEQCHTLGDIFNIIENKLAAQAAHEC